jgi:hypothetical protein
MQRMDMSKNKTLAIAAITALLIATVALTTDNASATKKKTQTNAQENACGNGLLPLDIFCQNASSQVQGRDNDVSVTTSQPSIATGNLTQTI